MKLITGIILAGGKSSRMGEEKGLVLYKGKPMVEYAIELFQQLGYQTIIIANDERYEKYNIPVYQDIIPEKGPMAGIYTGLTKSANPWNAVITCDVPLIDFKVFKQMEEHLDDCEAIMSKYDDRLQPLTAMYQTSTVNRFYRAIKNDKLRVRELRSELKTKIITFDQSFATSFINMNTKEDLERCK